MSKHEKIEELEQRVEELEDQTSSPDVSRRRMLQGAGLGVLGVGSLLGGSAAYSEPAGAEVADGTLKGIGQIGTDDERVGELFVENIDNFSESGTFETVTTGEAVIGGSPYHDIRDFGASGNASPSENTSAIQDAIDEAGTDTPILIPPGTFEHEGITVSQNVEIIGCSDNRSRLKVVANNPNITIEKTEESFLDSVRLRNLMLEGDEEGSDQHGIYLDGTSSSWNMEDLVIRRHGADGIKVVAGTLGPFSASSIVSRGNGGWGINLDASVEGERTPSSNVFSLRGFSVRNNGDGGIRIQGGNENGCDGMRFSDGIVESNDGDEGILLSGRAQYGSIRDTWIEANGTNGIKLVRYEDDSSATPNGWTFDSIFVHSGQDYAVRVEDGRENRFINVDPDDVGLWLRDAQSAAGNLIMDWDADIISSGRETKLIEYGPGDSQLVVKPGIDEQQF